MSGKTTAADVREVGDLLTMAEAMEVLKTTRSTLSRWMRAGRIAGRKIGRQWRFSREEIERFLSGGTARVQSTVGLSDLHGALSIRLREAAGREAPPAGEPDDLVDLILALAVELRASDVHLDPRGHADPEVEAAELSSEALLRFRIDGVLQRIAVLDLRLLPALAGALKARAGCDVRERTVPQDGRFSARIAAGGGDRTLELRICFLPAALGECVAIRIMDQSSLFFSLERIGLGGEDLDRTRRALFATQGLIVVTGPTGSGKTTTHYSCLREIVGEDRKFMSLEDPVEHHLPGVVQVPIRAEAGMTFSSAFRHLLRCDPDVILIGEIRDPETLQICCSASLTGHLVQTTLHAASAAGALARMRDLGVAPYLLADAVSLVIAQRIVRKVCPECGEPGDPLEADLAWAQRIAARGGLDWDSLPRKFRRGSGCPRCAAGYRGRIGLYETLRVTAGMREALREGAPEEALRTLAVSEGMTTLEADGIRKAAEGLTTIEEVVRVHRPESG